MLGPNAPNLRGHVCSLALFPIASVNSAVDGKTWAIINASVVGTRFFRHALTDQHASSQIHC
jgi:hypothetical protein